MINEFHPGVDAISSECDIKPNPSLNLLDLIGTKCGDVSTKDSVERDRPVTNVLPDSRRNGANNYMPDREFLEFTNPFADRSLSSNFFVQEARRELLDRYTGADNRPESLLQHMREIESATRVPQLRPDQIERVYTAASNLLGPGSDGSALSMRERSLLARTILENAARPETIHQGVWKTCQVAVIEEHAYTNNPELAAEAVSRIAISAMYFAGDGRQINIPPDQLHPLSDARRGFEEQNTPDGVRNYASQLLQGALVNDTEQRRDRPRQYRVIEDANGMREAVEYNGRVEASGPIISPQQIVETARRLGLSNFSIIDHGSLIERNGDQIFTIRSEDELRRIVSQAQYGRLPLPILLDVRRSPKLFGAFPADQNGAHVINIRSFDPRRNTVNISNQWEQRFDYTDIPLSEIFRAMNPGR